MKIRMKTLWIILVSILAFAQAQTIRVWTHQNNAFNAGLETLAQKYMAENPGVKVSFETFGYDTYIQTLQVSMPAGTEADVLQMFGSWVCSYAKGGYLAAVPAEILTIEQAHEQIFDAQIGGYTCDNTLYGIPQEFNIEYGAVLVNTQTAKEAGLEDITKGWSSWDDFIADAKKLTVTQDGVMTRAGYHFTSTDALIATFYSLILQNGGQYLTKDGFSVNTPEGKAALELIKRMVDEGLVDPVLFNQASNWVGQSYFDGTSAMGLSGPWVIPAFSGDYPEVAEVTEYVPLPYEGQQALIAASGWGLAVSANSKVQDAAWDFVRYVALNADNAVSWNIASGTLPALKANTEGDNAKALIEAFPFFKPFLEVLPFAQYEGAFPDRDLALYEISYPRLLEFAQGLASAEETLEAIDREVNESF